MAEKSDSKGGVWVRIPAKIGKDTESVRFWSYKDKRTNEEKVMVEITLPPGTEHNGEDLSFYKFSVTRKQLDPGGQQYSSSHSVLLPSENSEGEPWNVKLTRDFGSRDKIGYWVPDVRVHVMTSAELKTTCREQYEAYKEHRLPQRERRPTDEEMIAITMKAQEKAIYADQLLEESEGYLGREGPFIPYNKLTDEQRIFIDGVGTLSDRQLKFQAVELGYGWDKLADDPSGTLRRAVAMTGYAPEKFLHDEDPVVRRAMAQKGYCLEKLVDDPDPMVRWYVAAQGYGWDKLAYDLSMSAAGCVAEVVWVKLNALGMTLEEWKKLNPGRCALAESGEKPYGIDAAVADAEKSNAVEQEGSERQGRGLSQEIIDVRGEV